MKRCILTAGIVLAVLVPTVAFGSAPTPSHVRQYKNLYERVVHKFNARTPGRNIVRWGMANGQPATDAAVTKSIHILHDMLAPAPAPGMLVVPQQAPVQTSATPPATQASTSYSGGGYANVPGVPASFAACVAMRESTDGAGSSNIYGILGPGGQGSLASQKAAFSQMYAARGTQPWAPYDGC